MFALGFGAQEIGIVALVIVLLFGAKKIPELARGLGEGIKEFKKSARTAVEEEDKEKKAEEQDESQAKE